MEQERRPGLTEALFVWGAAALFATAIFVTYARLPPEELYHTSGSGIDAGASRVVVWVGYPFSIVAVALAGIAAARIGTRGAAVLAVVAVALCATIGFPGVIDQSDLDARPINGLAAVGVALALGLTIFSVARDGVGPTRPAGPLDAARALLAAMLVFAALPWLFAELGFYVSDVPLLGKIFLAEEVKGSLGAEPSLHAVHLGEHHGLDGIGLALVAVFLSRVPRQLANPAGRVALTIYLSLMLVYGLANALQDFWNEQLVKRGTVSAKIPSLIRPDLSWAWAAILVATALICVAASRVVRVDHPEGGTR
jgi:hypothetical protein